MILVNRFIKATVKIMCKGEFVIKSNENETKKNKFNTYGKHIAFILLSKLIDFINEETR